MNELRTSLCSFEIRELAKKKKCGEIRVRYVGVLKLFFFGNTPSREITVTGKKEMIRLAMLSQHGPHREWLSALAEYSEKRE